MNEERFIEIETRIAFQEETIKTLSEVIYKQQIKMDELENLYSSLKKETDKQNKSKFESGAPVHEKPPHY